MDDREHGQRIARARRRRGLSQAALAGLVGRSESWLSQVERGKRSFDSHAVLTHMAEILRVDVAELTASQEGSAKRYSRYPGTEQIEQAMVSYAALSDRIARQPGKPLIRYQHLRHRVSAVHSLYQAARYQEAGLLLPTLITDIESASRAADVDDLQFSQLRASVYDTTAALLNRVGERALAWVAADRAISAGEQTGMPLIVALGAYRMSYVLASQKHPSEGLNLAVTAADAIASAMRAASPDPDQISLCGGLYLAAANAAALQYDGALSSSLLKKASQLAGQLGTDANFMGTAFGPANVQIHLMSTSARLGDWATVVRVGESIDAAAMPAGLVARRTQVKLDLAHAYAMRRQDAAAVNTLIAAERLSPQLVRFDDNTGNIINSLLKREHRASTPQLRPLAHRAGLL